jgi:transposase
MESTGIYWIPLYEILLERGFKVFLVNAHHVKNVPGRKTDIVDCQWIQELHTYGLLRGSFIPPQEILALRAYMRLREKHVENAAAHLQRLQKALGLMNLQIHHVISDLSGATGMKILRDIVSGMRDPKELAKHRHRNCKASNQEIEASLTGNYRSEYVFMLRQGLLSYDHYQALIRDCDEQLELLLERLEASHPIASPMAPHPLSKRRRRDTDPSFEIRSPLHRLSGTDLTQLPGIGPYSALQLTSEIGLNVNAWPTAKHFTSWLTLAPRNKISGGKLLSSRTLTSASRAAKVLRMAAVGAGKTSTRLGAFYRRTAMRRGKAKAVTATARKLAELVYLLLKTGTTYVEFGEQAYQETSRRRFLRKLRKQATSLGFQLVETESSLHSELTVS